MPIPVRGLRNLRTRSGCLGAEPPSYQSYMQVTCLEMERARRQAERRSAAKRVQLLDARLEEIEREKRALLERLGAARVRAGGFRIRY